MKKTELKRQTTGRERAAARQADHAAWVERAYSGLPYPTGPRRPIKRRKAVRPSPNVLSNPSFPGKHVVVWWPGDKKAGLKEIKYHFTKGFRAVLP